MNKINFSIDYYQVLQDDDYKMILECYVVSDGSNRHNTFFDIETIKKAYPTLANIPLICLWDGYDFKEHARDDMAFKNQKFVGLVPETNRGEILEYQNKMWQKVDVIIWKAYNPEMAQRLAYNKDTAISMEIDVLDSYERPDGLLEITDFKYCGICLLGKQYTPAIPSAHVNVVKFSEYVNDIDEFKKILIQYSTRKEVEKQVDFSTLMGLFEKQLEDDKLILHGCDKKYVYGLSLDGKMFSLKYGDVKEPKIDFSTKKEVFATVQYAEIKADTTDNVYAIDLIAKKYAELSEEMKKKVEAEKSKKTEDSKDDPKDSKTEDKKEDSKFSDKEKEELQEKFAEIEAENKELKKYKEDKEKEDKQEKANKLYAEHDGYLTADDIVEFDKKLFSCEFSDFEAQVSHKVLSKYKLNQLKNSENNKNKNDIDITALFSKDSIKNNNKSNANSLNSILDSIAI